jgi:general secretion pathway protein D
MTDPSFQLVIRALNQKKGVDLLSAPKVTTKSGQRAVIEIIREFRYPTEFDPPQIPQNFGNQGASTLRRRWRQPPSSFPSRRRRRRRSRREHRRYARSEP